MPQDNFERAVDNAIAGAIDATSNEIFDAAFGKDESTLDETGDQTLETMGEGLEGEIEADEEPEESEDSEGEETESEDKGEKEGDAKEAKPDEEKPEVQAKTVEPEGRIPPGKLREANEARRLAEAKIAELSKQRETEQTQTRRELDELKGQITGLTQLLRQQGKPAETPAPEKPKRPDMFEDPDGFTSHIETQISQAVQPLVQQIQQGRVATSFEIAHAIHKDGFDKAIAAVQALDPNNPDNKSTVQRIWNSPNPGEALVQWNKRNETLREVGDDPAAYRERLEKQTRDALAKDPEFRKQLLAELRAEAEGDGTPNAVFTPPRSLNGARGSRVAADTSVLSDDPQAIFDSAFAAR